MSYKEDIKIDKERLDRELMNQASLYLEYSKNHADAIKFRDNCKNHLKVVDSELHLYLTKNWKSEFDTKPTAPTIAAWITTQKKHKKAQEALIKAEWEVNTTDSIQWSFAQRKSALEGLVTLIVTGFYAEPSPKNPGKRRKKLSNESLEKG